MTETKQTILSTLRATAHGHVVSMGKADAQAIRNLEVESIEGHGLTRGTAVMFETVIIHVQLEQHATNMPGLMRHRNWVVVGSYDEVVKREIFTLWHNTTRGYHWLEEYRAS